MLGSLNGYGLTFGQISKTFLTFLMLYFMVTSTLIKQFAYAHPWLVATNLPFMALSPVYDIYVPHLYGKVIKAIQRGNGLGKTLVLLIVTLGVVMYGYEGLDIHNAYLIPAFQGFFRTYMLQHVLKTYESQQQELPVGEILSKMISVPPLIQDWFTRTKDYLIPYALAFIGMIGYFTYYDRWLGLAMFLMVCVLFVALLTTPQACMASSISTSRTRDKIYEDIEDVLRNNVSIYESDQVEPEKARLKGYEQRFARNFQNTMLCIVQRKSLTLPFLLGFIVFFVLRCRRLIATRKMAVSTFVALFMMITGLITNMAWVVDIVRELTFNVGTFQEVAEYFERPPGTAPHDAAHVASESQWTSRNQDPPATGIGLVDVTYHYANSPSPILHRVTVHFAKGQKTAIVGEIASGKTTLLKLLIRFLKPAGGDLYVDGSWYSAMSIADLRRKLRYVPQLPTLLNRSILENILYGNKQTREDEVVALLKQLALYEEFSRQHGGLHANVGKNGSKLSGGQRQLVWCLRAFLHRPDYIVLDEPTVSMDPHTKQLFKRLLDHFAIATTVIMVSHDPFLVDVADRVVTMEDGRIVRS